MEEENKQQESNAFGEEPKPEGESNIFEEEPKQDFQKWVIGGIVVFALIVLVAALVVLLGGQDGPVAVNDEPEPLPVNDDEDVILFGVLPLQNPTQMLDRFGHLEEYLNEYTDMNIEMRFYPTEGELGGFSAVVSDFINDKLGFVFLAPVTTIQAYGNIGDRMEVIACGERYDGSPTYQGDLLVLKDSPYQSIWDLEGKVVAGTSISSTSGGLMPLGMMAEEGIDPTTFFIDLEGNTAGISYLGSHDKAVEALLTGIADGAFVNEQTMDKFLADGAPVRSIWRHAPVPEFPVSANRNVVTEEQIEQMREALLNSYQVDPVIHQSVDSGYNRFVEVSIEDYLPVRDAIDNVHGPIFYDLDRWGKEDEEEEEEEEVEEEEVEEEGDEE